jgi:hypothetical protein
MKPMISDIGYDYFAGVTFAAKLWYGLKGGGTNYVCYDCCVVHRFAHAYDFGFGN